MSKSSDVLIVITHIITTDEKGHDWELFEAHFLGPLLLLLATSNYRIGLVGKKGELLSTAPGCYIADW